MCSSRQSLLEMAASGGAGAGVLSLDLTPACGAVRQLAIGNAREHRTVCPCRSLGCGLSP